MTPLVLVGCGAIFGIPSDVQEQTGTDAATDAALAPILDSGSPPTDAPAPAEGGTTGTCASTDPFGAPVTIGELQVGGSPAADARLSDDELTVYYASKNPGVPAWALFTATRGDRHAKFNKPTTLLAGGELSSGDRWPSVSTDGNTLFFVRGGQILTGERKTGDPTFQVLNQLLLTGGRDTIFDVFVRADRPREMWFSSGSKDVVEPFDVFFATTNDDKVWLANVDPAVNTSGKNDVAPVISKDGLTLYFAKVRDPDLSNRRFWDIWMATRAARDGTFGAPARLEPLVGVGAIDTLPTWISPDNCRLYLWRQTEEKEDTATVLVATRAR